MGFLGDILSTVVNMVNIPAEAIDKIVLDDHSKEGTFSSVGKEISKIVKKVDD